MRSECHLEHFDLRRVVLSTKHISFGKHFLFSLHDIGTTFNSTIHHYSQKYLVWLMDEVHFCNCFCTIKSKIDSFWSNVSNGQTYCQTLKDLSGILHKLQNNTFKFLNTLIHFVFYWRFLQTNQVIRNSQHFLVSLGYQDIYASL